MESERPSRQLVRSSSCAQGGQTLVGLLVSAAIGVIILIAVTDIMNFLYRGTKANQNSIEFTQWVTTLTNFVRNQAICSQDLFGAPLNTDGTCTVQATINNPAGCSVAPNLTTAANCALAGGNWIAASSTCSDPRRVSPALCTASGGTWKATPWLLKPTTPLGTGLEVTSLCLRAISFQGYGRYMNESVYNIRAELKAGGQSDSLGNSLQENNTYFQVTVDTSVNPPTVKNCGGPYGTWTTMNATGEPPVASLPAAVWTGSQAIFWGGYSASVGGCCVNTGGIYDPIADSWATITTSNAPLGGTNKGVWDGNRMITWGMGATHPTATNTGGQYDPVANSWTPTATFNAPVARYDHAPMIWTGAYALVFGGLDNSQVALNSGGRYDPSHDRWYPMTTTNATPRDKPISAWDGSKAWYWGGATLTDNTGDSYDPTNDVWVAGAMTSTGAPAGRSASFLLYTGTSMLLWGGADGTNTLLNTGGIYNPSANTWAAMTTTGAPPPETLNTGVWTGSKMLVWGGSDVALTTFSNQGGSYDPVANVWGAIITTGAPSPRSSIKGVWTGQSLLIWGGYASGPTILNTGGAYTPP